MLQHNRDDFESAVKKWNDKCCSIFALKFLENEMDDEQDDNDDNTIIITETTKTTDTNIEEIQYDPRSEQTETHIAI